MVIAWAVAESRFDCVVEHLLTRILYRRRAPQLTPEYLNQLDIGFDRLSVLFIGRPRDGEVSFGLVTLRFGHALALRSVTAAITAPDPDDQKQEHDGGVQRCDPAIALAPPPKPLGVRNRTRQDRLSRPEPAQIFGEGKHIGITARDVFFQAFQTDRLQVARRFGLEQRRGHRLLVPDHVESFDDRRSLKGWATREQLVEDCAQGILVRGRPHGLALAPGLFGSHVARRTQDRAATSLSRVALQPLHQPEVGDLQGAIGGQEDIGRFEVAVDHLALVRNVHCPGQNLDDPGGLIDWLRLAANHVGEAAARNIFEREIREPVLLADREDLDDIEVFDCGNRLGFRLEANEILGPRAGAGPNHLQSDEPVEPLLARLVDDPHPTPAKQLQNLVAGNTRPCADRAVSRRRQSALGIIEMEIRLVGKSRFERLGGSEAFGHFGVGELI